MNIIRFGRDVLRMRYSPLQETILLAARGETLSDAQAALFERHAGRPWPGPGEPPDELHVVTGRQSGKTGYLAATLVLHAAFDPRTVAGLAPGYLRDVLLVSPTQRQTGIAYRRIAGLVQDGAALRSQLVSEPTRSELLFKFGVRIGVWVAKGASLRGTQPKLFLIDEAAFLPSEGARADVDLVEAVRPGMAMIDDAQTVTISSPWIEQGLVYERFRRRAELEGAFVFQAASWELNPYIPARFLERERQRDPETFRREFGGEFIGSISAFLPAESVFACVASGRSFLPPQANVRYVAAVDQAYKQDTFVLTIAHREGDSVVIDRIRSWTPKRGSPVKLADVVPMLKAELAPYGVQTLIGDQFSSEPFREVMRREGLSYEERTFTAQSKPNMYASLKAAILEGRIELLDHEDSLRELRTLEARAMPGGNVRIEAPRGAGASDDFADTLAILAHELRPAAASCPIYVNVPSWREQRRLDEARSRGMGLALQNIGARLRRIQGDW